MGKRKSFFLENQLPKWNFHKIIFIGKDGKVLDTFASMTNPSSKKFIKAIIKSFGLNLIIVFYNIFYVFSKIILPKYL